MPTPLPNLSPMAQAVHSLSLEGFVREPRGGFGSHPSWAALRRLGTRLWLDTGDLEAARSLWTDDFSNLTTNNTLVNREVQKGLFDDVIRRCGQVLREASPGIDPQALVYETGFVVNCRTALRLVAAFDATVSVELHPGMANDVETSVEYGRRYFAVCPDRFIIKVPLTPAGYVITRRLSEAGIPVNFTLGFSARQNVLAAAFSRPAYVNVFMGRLNSFVVDNGLGDGRNVGERATVATQRALLQGRARHGWQTLLIGASMRSADQLRDLAGLDVYTIPTAAAQVHRDRWDATPGRLESTLDWDFPVDSEPSGVLETLWSQPPNLARACAAAATVDPTGWTGAEFSIWVRRMGMKNLFHDWSADEAATISADGKIPKWAHWSAALLDGAVALDDLMTASALASFVADQSQLDDRIRRLLEVQGGIGS